MTRKLLVRVGLGAGLVAGAALVSLEPPPQEVSRAIPDHRKRNSHLGGILRPRLRATSLLAWCCFSLATPTRAKSIRSTNQDGPRKCRERFERDLGDNSIAAGVLEVHRIAETPAPVEPMLRENFNDSRVHVSFGPRHIRRRVEVDGYAPRMQRQFSLGVVHFVPWPVAAFTTPDLAVQVGPNEFVHRIQ